MARLKGREDGWRLARGAGWAKAAQLATLRFQSFQLRRITGSLHKLFSAGTFLCGRRLMGIPARSCDFSDGELASSVPESSNGGADGGFQRRRQGESRY